MPPAPLWALPSPPLPLLPLSATTLGRLPSVGSGRRGEKTKLCGALLALIIAFRGCASQGILRVLPRTRLCVNEAKITRKIPLQIFFFFSLSSPSFFPLSPVRKSRLNMKKKKKTRYLVRGNGRTYLPVQMLRRLLGKAAGHGPGKMPLGGLRPLRGHCDSTPSPAPSP